MKSLSLTDCNKTRLLDRVGCMLNVFLKISEVQTCLILMFRSVTTGLEVLKEDPHNILNFNKKRNIIVDFAFLLSKL